MNEKLVYVCVTEEQPRAWLLTTEGHDVAAVFVNKLPGDSLLHYLLHLRRQKRFSIHFRRERESRTRVGPRGLGIKMAVL